MQHDGTLWPPVFLQDAQEADWTPRPVAGGAPPFWEAWDMFHFEDFPGNIHWAAVSRQVRFSPSVPAAKR